MTPDELRPIRSREEALQIHLPPRPKLVCPPSPEEAVRAARYPLRGTPVQYRDPTEPVADAQWEALG